MTAISGYIIAETLFESRRTVIYRARREADGLLVVLKLLNERYPTPKQIARFRREYRVTQHLQMDGVIGVLGLERHGSSVAIVLEDFGAASLERLLLGRRLDLPAFLRFAVWLTKTTGHVHRRRFIHKDINPANILWNPKTDVFKLIDFGIATELPSETTAPLSPSVLEGTLPYLSPEATGRMNRALDYRTDFYSMGVTFYQLLTGRLPFSSNDPMELVHCHIAAMPSAPSDVSPGVPTIVSDIVLRLLAKRAEDRYQSAFTLQADLERCLVGLDAGGRVARFDLGSADVADRFQLSQQLYGREREGEALIAAYERACEGEKGIVLVSGYSGIGKTSLIHEVHRPIVARRGYFISGKFDQFNRNVPYASLIQAFQELIRQILTEPAERVAEWRSRILAALGANVQIIVDAIGELQFIVGKQPPAPELPPREAENRFNITFERFVRTFAAPKHPLALFLDDLQWADLSSLGLIERLMTDPGAMHLLLIGSYRDNEVTPSHPLVSTLEALRRARAAIHSITLGPLRREHCVELLADTLHADATRVGPLADMCLEKTGGNPFFLRQFLLSLHAEGKFQFDEEARRWTWDVEQILQMRMTDNIVDFMASKIQRLAGDTQNVLRLAACIGNRFDLKTLSIIHGNRPIEASASMEPALREGLVVPIGDAYKFLQDRDDDALQAPDRDAEAALADSVAHGGAVREERIVYQFLHDRVQQAAYALSPASERPRLHLRVGRLLLRSTPEAEREEQIFAIVNHLNQGSALIEELSERDTLAEMNLLAGKKAKASAAPSAASDYLEAGLALLGEQGFERRYDLAIALHSHAAEASFLSGNLQRMERHAESVLQNARDVLDSVKIYETRIQGYGQQNKFFEAIQIARQVLSSLGIDFPPTPRNDDVGRFLEEARALLAGRPIASLIDLPEMTDPVKVATMRILAMTIPNCYIADPMLLPLVAVRLVTQSVLWGNTGASACGYAAYGIILCGQLGDVEQGYEFGELAVRIIERCGAKEYEGRTRFIVSAFVRHWKEQLRHNWRSFKGIYQICLDTGDLDLAAYAANADIYHAYDFGTELAEFERSAAVNVQAIEQIKHEPCTHWTKLLQQVAQNLMGTAADPCRLTGDVCDEAKLVEILSKANDGYGLGSVYGYKTQLYCMFGRYAEAMESAAVTQRYLDAMLASVPFAAFSFYSALAALGAYGDLSQDERARALRQVADSQQRLRRWAEFSPMNHAHRYWLIEAEQSRISGEAEMARELYYRAIELAEKNQYLHEEALASERFATFLEGRGEVPVAQLYMTKAHHLYELWGATAKVQDLEVRHPALLGRRRRRPGAARKLDVTVTTEEVVDAADSLDLVSVLKASQAISGEVVLADLVRKMMLIVIENAGAQRGFLLLEDDDPLIVQASGGEVTLHRPSTEQPPDLPQAVIRYVRLTQETVVRNAGANAGPFETEPYLQRHRPASILCLPLVRQKTIVAVLYLEHELIENVFTANRREVLELLSSQMAISIENARLYETLDRRVKERTLELSKALDHLRQTQNQLVLKEKLASLGMLTSGIAHELKNPLNFINNFAELCIELSAEVREELARSPGDTESVDRELENLQEIAAKICKHGKRADRIVCGMLEHARGSTRPFGEVEWNTLVRGYASAACDGQNLGREGSRVEFAFDLDEAAGTAIVASEDLGRVVTNLVTNAVYAARVQGEERGAAFAPSIVISTRGCCDTVEVRVKDNGAGIPPALRDKLFMPFFTTKPPGEGTGLGLSISYDIVVSGHGGEIGFDTEEGRFTEFFVRVPRRREGVCATGVDLELTRNDQTFHSP
ncbi:AAA family ATPase [Sorangium cellulosum]|uniref:trifunctional serine/threonine-protein kinase/ATP-binding protein/sensor histidine kinase n=1 Tax=Sorangium cellulosum TaxID=56 RepID=UPI003D9A4B24